jgi:hypothetical protein
MERYVKAVLAGLSLMLATPDLAQAPTLESDAGEVVVHGYPPHCHPRPGDPQDEVDLRAAVASPQQQQVVRIDPATGKLGLFPDDYPSSSSDMWQRDCKRLNDYVFRVPSDDTPLCIGSRNPNSPGLAQLRRAFDARAYWGKVMRFTAFVATRHVAGVSFWIATGAGQYEVGHKVKLGSNILLSGHFPSAPLRGNHEWMPITYTIGPFPCGGSQISYGVTLDGGGDVWLYQPKFEEIPDNALPRHLLHGKAYLDSDRICRHFLYETKFR